MATEVNMGNEVEPIKLHTPGMDMLARAAASHSFEIVEMAVPRVRPGQLLSDFSRDRFAPLVDLTVVATLAPTEPDYARKRFMGRVDSLNNRLKESGHFNEFNVNRLSTYKPFWTRLIAAGLVGHEEFANTTGNRKLIPLDGVNLPEEDDSANSSGFLHYEVNVFPDRAIAALALKTPERGASEKGLKLSGPLLKPVRMGLVAGRHA